jgi:hypothetical protein
VTDWVARLEKLEQALAAESDSGLLVQPAWIEKNVLNPDGYRQACLNPDGQRAPEPATRASMACRAMLVFGKAVPTAPHFNPDDNSPRGR